MSPGGASFLVTNETAEPLSVRLSDLTLRSDEAGLAPADRAQPMRVLGARARVIGRGYTMNFRRPHKIPP